jgi:hypothetical protein
MGPNGVAAVTPDGVSTKDWDQVHELAVEIVNASAVEDETAGKVAYRRLMELLDQLQMKYGPLPSLLATRGDYAQDPSEREYWLEAAHEQALRREDGKNLVWIASSLASLYIEDLRDARLGREWIIRLAEYLQRSPDESEAEDLARLRGQVESLPEPPPNRELHRPSDAK